MKSPVLFLIFKREDTTRRVFERIREARPPKLYIAADGPRESKIGEREQCEATRKIVENIDWPCEVNKLYQDKNLGCGKGVSTAITWFFEHEEQGIIIEDDILAHPDFFLYCDEMLEKFKDDTSIQMISGHNVFYDGFESNTSYYKSSSMQIWGWASWRRVWMSYEFDAAKIPFDKLMEKAHSRYPKNCIPGIVQRYRMMADHKCDTWDIQLYLNQILNDRYSIISYKNQTQNIGIGSTDAVHTTGYDSKVANHIATSVNPIIHPKSVCEDKAADKLFFIDSGLYRLSMVEIIIRKIYSSIKKLFK